MWPIPQRSMLSAFNVNCYSRKYRCCRKYRSFHHNLLPPSTYSNFHGYAMRKLLHHNPALGLSLIQKYPPRGTDEIRCKQRNTILFTLPTTTSMADTTGIQQPKSSRANGLSQTPFTLIPVPSSPWECTKYFLVPPQTFSQGGAQVSTLLPISLACGPFHYKIKYEFEPS